MAIAIILVLAGLGFMATVSAAITTSATVMAELLALIALQKGGYAPLSDNGGYSSRLQGI